MTRYTVKFEIDMEASSPLEAAKKVALMLEQDSDFIFTTKNTETKECFSIDLSSEDEDAVLPITEKDFNNSI